MTPEKIDEFFDAVRPEITVAIKTLLLDAGHVGLRYYYADVEEIVDGAPRLISKQVSDAGNGIRTSRLAHNLALKYPGFFPKISAKDDPYYDAPKAIGLWLQDQVDEKQKPFVDWGTRVGGVDPMKNCDWSSYEWLYPLGPDDERHPRFKKQK